MGSSWGFIGWMDLWTIGVLGKCVRCSRKFATIVWNECRRWNWLGFTTSSTKVRSYCSGLKESEIIQQFLMESFVKNEAPTIKF